MKRTNSVTPGYADKRHYIIVDENGHAYEWKSDAFHADICSAYIRKDNGVMVSVRTSHPSKSLRWEVFNG